MSELISGSAACLVKLREAGMLGATQVRDFAAKELDLIR
jgi:hypothetical protein